MTFTQLYIDATEMLKGQETLDKTSFLPRFVCRFFVRFTCICKTEGKTRVCLFTFQYTGELLETLVRLGSSRLVSFFSLCPCLLFVCLFAWIFLLFMFMSKRVLVKSSSFNLILTPSNSFLWKKKQSQIKLIVFVIVGSKNYFNLLFIVCCWKIPV